MRGAAVLPGPTQPAGTVTRLAEIQVGPEQELTRDCLQNRLLRHQFCPRFKFRMAATCISTSDANPCTRVSHHIPPCRGRRKVISTAGCETGRPSAAGGKLLVVAAANAHHGDGLLAGEVGFVVADTGVVELHQRASRPGIAAADQCGNAPQGAGGSHHSTRFTRQDFPQVRQDAIR